MSVGTIGHLIVFKDGKRIDKAVAPHNHKKARKLAKQIRKAGGKAVFAYARDKTMFPPPGTQQEKRDEGMWWCVYCGEWRWFRVPKGHVHAEVNSREWFMNSFRNQLTRVCSYCEISEHDWYIKRANGLWGETRVPKRRSRSRRRVRSRAS